jgi:osmotically inducible protein OsmC
VVSRRLKVEADDVTVESRVHLLPTEERGFKLAVDLDVGLPSIDDPGQAHDLVAKAHKVCPYSNATRGNVDVALTVNGEALAEAR